ncbi:MAG TPA: aldo/keto reductase [Thermodesulfobacteriota bacterium]|nr:aldo/keto reductase [Thermodesulfobacteriota bacterium]
MVSEKMGRRKFLKQVSSALLGMAAVPVWKASSASEKNDKTQALEYRTLGKTGMKVTAVSMGVMNCSDPAVLLRAFDLGINFYDTADCYMHGRNEEMVGKAFEGKRAKVFIQTKVHAHDEKKMRASVERSLRRLRTDYVDVLVWHGHSKPDEVSDPRLFEFMSKMKQEGKVRFTGFSAHSHMASLLREAAKSNLHDIALVSYNFTHSKELKEAVALAARSGIGIVAMKTQAGGYKKEKMAGLNPHQAALKFILRDQNVSAAVPGVTTIEQIEECAAVMGASLSKSNLDELKRYQSFLQGKICTLCGGCVGECPYGVLRSDLLRAVIYHEGYGNVSLARDSLQTIAMEDLQRCSECPSCSVVCRRGLDMKAQVKKAQELMAGSPEEVVRS